MLYVLNPKTSQIDMYAVPNVAVHARHLCPYSPRNAAGVCVHADNGNGWKCLAHFEVGVSYVECRCDGPEMCEHHGELRAKAADLVNQGV